LLNEPAERQVAPGLLKWKDLAKRVTDALRVKDPNRRVIISAVYGNPDKLSKLKKMNIPNAVYNFHAYFPSNFRNQGLNGRKINVRYPKKKFNKKALAKSLKKGRAFQKRNKVDIMIGEFAAPRWAPKGSAFRYLRD